MLRNESNVIHAMSHSKNNQMPEEVVVATSVERLVESLLKTSKQLYSFYSSSIYHRGRFFRYLAINLYKEVF